jgi:hypothetical protein
VTRTSRTLVVLAATFVLTLTGGPSALTLAGGSHAGDGTGPSGTAALTRASAAAVEATGGGVVTGTEFGAEESCYEVRVTLADGRQVDVQLDKSFTVVSSAMNVARPQVGSAGG